jgi:hypothetical protein
MSTKKKKIFQEGREEKGRKIQDATCVDLSPSLKSEHGSMSNDDAHAVEICPKNERMMSQK